MVYVLSVYSCYCISSLPSRVCPNRGITENQSDRISICAISRRRRKGEYLLPTYLSTYRRRRVIKYVYYLYVMFFFFLCNVPLPFDNYYPLYTSIVRVRDFLFVCTRKWTGWKRISESPPYMHVDSQVKSFWITFVGRKTFFFFFLTILCTISNNFVYKNCAYFILCTWFFFNV